MIHYSITPHEFTLYVLAAFCGLFVFKAVNYAVGRFQKWKKLSKSGTTPAAPLTPSASNKWWKQAIKSQHETITKLMALTGKLDTTLDDVVARLPPSKPPGKSA